MYDIQYLYKFGKELWVLVGDIEDDDMYTQDDYDLVMQVLEDRANETC